MESGCENLSENCINKFSFLQCVVLQTSSLYLASILPSFKAYSENSHRDTFLENEKAGRDDFEVSLLLNMLGDLT